MSELGDKSKLKIGQLGYSLDIISLDKHGPCYFDGVRYDIKAGTDIRKWAEVVVITITPEPTIIETWGIFPLSYGLVIGGFQTVAENTPLPITGGSRALTHVSIVATATGNTAIVTPSPGKKIRVHYFSMSNLHTILADVAMRFDTANSTAATNLKQRHGLAADGGNINANLIDANMEGAVDEVLYAYLAAAYANGVYFNVAYAEV